MKDSKHLCYTCKKELGDQEFYCDDNCKNKYYMKVDKPSSNLSIADMQYKLLQMGKKNVNKIVDNL